MIGRLACPVVMRKVALNRQNGLHDNVLDFCHKFVGVLILLPQSIKNFLHCPFVAFVIVHTLRRNKFFLVFVDCVVG